jgi:hypothetical protein
MNQLTKVFTLCAVSASMVFVACQKDDDSGTTSTTSTTSSTSTTSTTGTSKIDLLTGGSSKSWRVSAYYYDDTLEQVDPCEADDRYTLTKAGSTYSVNYGAVKCDPTETNESGTWKLINNEQEFEIDGDFAFTITELTASKVTFSSYDTVEVVGPGGGTSTRVIESKTIWVNP